MDPLSLFVGAVIAAAGFVAGRIRHRRAPSPPELPAAVCSCGHALSFHDPDSKVCHGRVRTPSRFDKVYGAIAYTMEPCSCRRYVGPVPLETYCLPEITD